MRKLAVAAAALALLAAPAAYAQPSYSPGQTGAVGAIASVTDTQGNARRVVLPQVSGFSQSVSLIPTVQNAAYASGNCIGGFNAVTVAQTAGQSGFVTNVRLTSIGGLTTGMTVYLFDANPSASTCTDKGTFTLATADVDKLIAEPFAITPAAPTGTTSSFGSQANMGRPFVAGGATTSNVKTVYVALVANGAMTPASATDIHVRLGLAF